jgi:hypothetical protein
MDEHDRRPSELIAAWKDPSFDPKLRAVYYARVVEIPTPRWTAYDAKRFGVQMAKDVPMTTQERALHVAHLVHAVKTRVGSTPIGVDSSTVRV